MWVKICGLTTPDAVAAAVAAGADAVGFVFHPGSPRHVTAEAARALAAGVPRDRAVVAVTRHPPQALVDEIMAVLRPTHLQTDAADLPALALPHGLETLPVLRTGGARPEEWPERFLYEAPASGAGHLADWDEARLLARRGGLVLAGGLSPANVARAIRTVAPFGVDVSSGVERAPGAKDPALIAEFVAAARAAAVGNVAAPCGAPE
jgi:phosphoribosylanthranilate isomerase